MTTNFIQFIQDFSLDNFLDSVQNIINWFISGITNLLDSIVWFLDLVGSSITNVVGSVNGFSGYVSALFNNLPVQFISLIVVALVFQIIFVFLRRMIS